MAKIGVVLSGCGVNDGSEIHEAVSVLLALDQRGASYECLAPDVAQRDVVNHATGQPATGEQRNVLVEAARIARGKITPLDKARVSEYDGFAFPGGYGAAKNLCSFAVDGAECEVHPDVKRLIEVANDAGRPILFCCISPVICAKVLGGRGAPLLTIGNDSGIASAIEAMGAGHSECGVTEVAVDRDNKIVSTPAYMYNASLAEVFTGIDRGVAELLRMVG